jgi:hypothetical protein
MLKISFPSVNIRTEGFSLSLDLRPSSITFIPNSSTTAWKSIIDAVDEQLIQVSKQGATEDAREEFLAAMEKARRDAVFRVGISIPPVGGGLNLDVFTLQVQMSSSRRSSPRMKCPTGTLS